MSYFGNYSSLITPEVKQKLETIQSFQLETNKKFVKAVNEGIKIFEEASEYNLKNYNWSFSENIPTALYYASYREKWSQEEINNYFISFYREEEELLKDEFATIKDLMGKGWVNTLDQCFENIKDGNFNLSIPFLIMTCEGAVKILLDRERDTNLYGGNLKDALKDLKQEVPDRFGTKKITESLVDNLTKKVFAGRVHNNDSIDFLNRNYILHGNDEPDRWGEKECYQLIALVSGIYFIKKYIEILNK